MSKKKMTTSEDDFLYLDKFDDQHQEILDNIEINESSDSETTDSLNFRVINTNNSYPQRNVSKVNTDIK
jgi:hypothetical protein